MTQVTAALGKLVVCVAMLVGCGGTEVGVGGGGTGGGPTSTPPPPSTTGGGITGFGSVIVDGTTWDDRNAVIDSENDPRVAAASAELALGKRVEITSTTAGVADRIRVEATVAGRISEVTAATTPPQFKVAGQTVRQNTSAAAGPITVLAGYASFAQIAVNDVVEVHGSLVFDSTLNRYVIQASRVEKLVDLPAGLQRISGVVENYTTSSTPPTFRLGELTVAVENTTTVVPANRALANGQRVIVFSNKAVTAGAAPRLSADVIRIRDSTPTTGTAKVELSGALSKFDAANSRFEVSGTTVDARNARIVPANQSLANNQYVVVRGTYNSGGVLVAEDVRIRNPANNDTELELKGSVTDYVSIANFKLRDVQINGTGATLNNCGNGLSNGLYVELKGRIDGATGQARATQIECKNPPGNATVTLIGAASNVMTTARTFTLTPSGPARTVNWTATTNFVGQLTPSNLDRKNVEVDGYTSGQMFVATKIKERKN